MCVAQTPALRVSGWLKDFVIELLCSRALV
jgi:hypothetical protein